MSGVVNALEAPAREGRRRPTAPPSPGARAVATAAYVFLASGLAVIVTGVLSTAPELVCAGGAIVALGFFSGDLPRLRVGGVTPITLFAFSAAVTGIADTIGLMAADSLDRGRYFLYAVDEHLFLASLLALAGGVLPVLGFRAVHRYGALGEVSRLLPSLRARIRDEQLVPLGLSLAVLAIALQISGWRPPLGTLLDFVFLMPSLVIFTLARAGSERGVRGATATALVIAVAEAGRALAFAYLRIEVLVPLVAFVFGVLLGRRSLGVLRSPVLAPVYVAMVLFVMYFGAFGAVRQHYVEGVQRIEAMHEYREQMELQQVRTEQSVLSRVTSFNQLSQVGRVVEEDGFLNGATLDYLAYAFIPRFLWPEKPLIAKGAWFAVRIGQATPTREGWYNNSVNMTVPGELYLNFGWLGVLLGCLAFGAILAVLWAQTTFWSDSRNVLGSAFGFYLLWVGFGLAADLQIVVTLFALYLLFVAIGAVMPGVGKAQRGRRPAAATGLADRARAGT